MSRIKINKKWAGEGFTNIRKISPNALVLKVSVLPSPLQSPVLAPILILSLSPSLSLSLLSASAMSFIHPPSSTIMHMQMFPNSHI